MLTLVIPLFFLALALFAGWVITDSLARGIAAGRQFVRELARLETGYCPAPPVRITRQNMRRQLGRLQTRNAGRGMAISRDFRPLLRVAA